MVRKAKISSLIAAAALLGASSLTQAASPNPSNKYDGLYYATIVETAFFGCQTDTTDIPPSPNKDGGVDGGDPVAAYLVHHQAEQRSTIAQRSAAVEVVSSGGVLTLPAVRLRQVEIRMDGTADNSIRGLDPEGTAIVSADGSITKPDAPEGVIVEGQFSADGALFNILISGVFQGEGPDAGCQDSFSQQILGISRDAK